MFRCANILSGRAVLGTVKDRHRYSATWMRTCRAFVGADRGFSVSSPPEQPESFIRLVRREGPNAMLGNFQTVRSYRGRSLLVYRGVLMRAILFRGRRGGLMPACARCAAYA